MCITIGVGSMLLCYLASQCTVEGCLRVGMGGKQWCDLTAGVVTVGAARLQHGLDESAQGNLGRARGHHAAAHDPNATLSGSRRQGQGVQEGQADRQRRQNRCVKGSLQLQNSYSGQDCMTASVAHRRVDVSA